MGVSIVGDALCLIDVLRAWPALLTAMARAAPVATAAGERAVAPSRPRSRRTRPPAPRADHDVNQGGGDNEDDDGAVPRAADSVRFLVDAMMGGLAKKLRSCGIDAVYGTLLHTART
jgi:hypothetical protein